MSGTITAPDGVSTTTFWADAATISFVRLAHATSHLFQLLLSPLFPWLTTEFSLSFSELGMGVAQPSRDLLIRCATPTGATGRAMLVAVLIEFFVGRAVNSSPTT